MEVRIGTFSQAVEMKTFVALIALVSGALMYLNPRYGSPETLMGFLLASAGMLYLLDNSLRFHR